MSFDEQPDGDIHGECAAEIRRLELALRIKTEEHDCCAKDLLLWRTSYESACAQNVHLCEKIDDCRPFLREGESQAEGLARLREKITEIFGRWTLFIDAQNKEALQDQLDACRPYLKEGETAADALARLSASAKWQPIATAPTHGARVLATWDNTWGSEGEHIEVCEAGECGGWFYSFDGDAPATEPTHWMPLPAAPTTTED